jgi:hypothetical protein
VNLLRWQPGGSGSGSGSGSGLGRSGQGRSGQFDLLEEIGSGLVNLYVDFFQILD